MLYLANNRLLLINNGNSLYRIEGDEPAPVGGDEFKFTIDTNFGTGDSFDLPLRIGRNYDFVVDWGDGSSDVITSYNQSEKLHTYSTGGEYQISITGLCETWYFNYSGDRLKLTSIDQWGNTGFIYMMNAFRGCSNLTTVNDIDGTWCSNVTNMQSMFDRCSSLTTLDVSNWNVSNVTRMDGMFNTCSSLETLNVSNWNVSNVTNMSNMFWFCTSLTTLNVSNWDVTNVTNMNNMFYGCPLTTLDVSTWDVSNVTNMSNMFSASPYLTTLDVSNWNVSNVTNMGGMFNTCSSLETLDVSTWDVSNVTDMSFMFKSCSLTTLDVSNWNVSNVTNMSGMFDRSLSLATLDVSIWNVSNVTTMAGMFSGTPLNTTSYDALLISWSQLPSLQSNVQLNAMSAKYSSGEATTAREILRSAPNNWKIFDGGQVI